MRYALILILAGSAGCLSSVVPSHDVDDAQPLSQMLSSGDYRGAGFVQMNRSRYVSGLHASDLVDIFVSTEAAADYGRVAPDDLATTQFPVGGRIVREVYDQGGRLLKLTVMEKRTPGWFTGGGDFFYGVTDAAGTPIPGEDGTPQWGALAACGTCHTQRTAEAFLFGAPRGNRMLR